jgi:NTP pyrophosphatase (non-canonical NTP hydrolase)
VNYIEQALRTKSDKFYPNNVDLNQLKIDLNQIIAVSNHLDILKKIMFYGKPINNEVNIPLNVEAKNADLLHSMIGIITEAGEVAEALLKWLETGELDVVNFVEEMGDSFWYFAIGLNAATEKTTQPLDFEYVQGLNINKLMHRFPEKFTEQKALNRDVDGERQILENKD